MRISRNQLCLIAHCFTCMKNKAADCTKSQHNHHICGHSSTRGDSASCWFNIWGLWEGELKTMDTKAFTTPAQRRWGLCAGRSHRWAQVTTLRPHHEQWSHSAGCSALWLFSFHSSLSGSIQAAVWDVPGLQVEELARTPSFLTRIN